MPRTPCAVAQTAVTGCIAQFTRGRNYDRGFSSSAGPPTRVVRHAHPKLLESRRPGLSVTLKNGAARPAAGSRPASPNSMRLRDRRRRLERKTLVQLADSCEHVVSRHAIWGMLVTRINRRVSLRYGPTPFGGLERSGWNEQS